jgi:hypothetical protein
MTSEITPDDFRRQEWIQTFGIHGSLEHIFALVDMGKSKNVKRGQTSL